MAVEVEAVDLPEVDADGKDEATLRDVVAEEVVVPVVGAPPTGWRVDRFRQSSGRRRLVSTPLWKFEASCGNSSHFFFGRPSAGEYATCAAQYCLLMICKAYEAFDVVANIWVLDPVNGWCAFQADEKLGAETCW